MRFKLQATLIMVFLCCCSQEIRKNCNKASQGVGFRSFLTAGKSISEDMVDQYANFGGYISFQRNGLLNPNSAEYASCTASIDFKRFKLPFDKDSVSENVQNAFQIWTSEHCLRAESDGDVIFHLYLNKEYVAIPIDFKAYDKRSQFLQKVSVYPSNIKNTLVSLALPLMKRYEVKTERSFDKKLESIVQYCQSVTQEVRSMLAPEDVARIGTGDLSINCSSLYEVGRFVARPKHNATKAQLAALAMVKERFERKMKEDREQFLGASVASDSKKEAMDAVDELEESFGVLADLRGSATFSINREAFESQCHLLIAAQECKKLVSAFEVSESEVKFTIQSIAMNWRILKIGIDASFSPLSVKSNFKFKESEQSLNDTKATEQSSMSSHFLSVSASKILTYPLFESLDSWAQKLMDNAREIGSELWDSGNETLSKGVILTKHGIVLVTNPKSSNSVGFQPSDSGTMFDVEEVLPMFALSTSDGVPFSGGSVLKSLPIPQKENRPSVDSTGVVSLPDANTSQPQQPSRNAENSIQNDANCAP